MEKEEKLLEVSVVAIRLSVSPRTVLRMVSDPGNPLKGVRLSKKCVRIIEESISKVISQRQI